jgi:hypothetical protein
MLYRTIKFPPVGVPHKGIAVPAERTGYIHPKDVLL